MHHAKHLKGPEMGPVGPVSYLAIDSYKLEQGRSLTS